VIFTWDDAKRTANLEKHGIDFPLAAKVLESDPLVRPDDRRDYGEERFIAMGDCAGRVYVVVFTVRDNSYRIISARMANARERRIYEQLTA